MSSAVILRELSLIIPCYKDAPHLRANTLEIIQVLETIHVDWEIIFVNDASPDNCLEIIQRMIAQDTTGRLRCVNHEQNTGRGRAVHDGILAAHGRFCGFLDIDLEVPAHYILPMLLALGHGADVACAQRVYKLRWRILHRAFLSRGYSMVSKWMLHSNLPDTEAGYKFFNRERILPVLDTCLDRGWFWDTEIMLRSQMAGLKIECPMVLFVRRPDKATTVRLVHDIIEYWRRLWQFRASLRKPKPAAAPIPAVNPPAKVESTEGSGRD